MNSSLSNVNTLLTSTSTSLKRTRSTGITSRTFDPSRAPSLPPLNSDLVLQVFTHKSLRRPRVKPQEYGDNEKLSQMGKYVLEMAVTHNLFCKRPLIEASDISKYRQRLLSSRMIEDWVAFYKLASKVRCHRDVTALLNSTPEIHDIFHAYVGGVYVSSGHQILNEWISALLEQELEYIWDELTESAQGRITPISKKPKNEYNSPPMPSGPLFPAQHYPAHTQYINPLASVNAHKPHLLSNPMAPAQPTLPFLPLFNQAAMQRRVTVEYQAEFSGPSHAGRWAVKCIVNGMCKGEGVGNSKQAAKEEAARSAYHSMGWT